MSAAERIESWSDHPVLLWRLHPCDEIWDALDDEPANDNCPLASLAKTFPEQPNRTATHGKLSHLPLARGATASTRQGRGDAFRSALLEDAHRTPPISRARTSVGRGLPPSKKYLPFFWDGDPMAFDYGDQPTTAYGRQRYDAFGRQVQTFDLDGTITLQSRYHALSTDLWDAADLTPGQHQGSYASERKDGHGRTAQTTERFRDHGSMEGRHVRTTYLPSGEPTSIARVTAGETPIVRWMQYDSLGRMVLNVEPNTTSGFVVPTNLGAPSVNYASLEAWRYQYNQFGDLIATSDARGCGQNFYYDGAGRILGEDYAPCEDTQQAYSAPASATDYENLEVAYFYDDPANVPASMRPAGWTGSVGAGDFTLGRAIAVFDRGSASFTTYDGRGRTVATQTRIATPTVYALNGTGPAERPQPKSLAERYALRVYRREMRYDAADREVAATTGAAELKTPGGAALVPELLNNDGESECTTEYSARGAVKEAGSSYGSLVSKITRSADNLVSEIVYGDAAQTRTAYLYDERRRISSVQTYRGPPASGAWDGTNPNSSTTNPDEPTRQMVLQDEDFIYDVVGNPVEIRDWRDAQDWPEGAKPVTKKIEYDDLYRATRIRYEYAAGDDDWKSPFQAEIDGSAANDDDRRAQPSPHIQFQKRILEQTFEYDWVGNNRKTGDDAKGFYDRSLGDIDDNDEAGKPYQLKGAALSGANGGSLQARYDAAGYMTKMQLARDGACIGGSNPGDCDQQFVYEWDEVGRLSRARRWDNNATSVDTFSPASAGTPAADLRHTYDASDQRVLKEAVDAQGNSSFTAYVFETLELRRAQFGEAFDDGAAPSVSDYEISHYTVVPYLLANGVRLSRVVYHASEDVPEEAYDGSGAPGDVNGPLTSSGKLHVFFELGDHLGSTSVVLDKATGELVERATFQGYGGAESDYRPDRWKSFREDYRFTGKEEDVEVGLQYFGKRYLNPLLGRWISADPLAVHEPGAADLNLYAYVSGEVLRNIDPLGLLSKEAQKRVDEHGQVRAEVEDHQEKIDYEKELLEQEITEKSYLAENEATDQDDLDTRNAEIAGLKGELESLKLKEANLKAYWQTKDAEFQRWFREETAPVIMAIPLPRDAQGQTQAGEGVAIVQKSDLPQAEAARELRAVLDTNENIKNGGVVGVGLMGGTEATMRITEGRSATPEEMRNAAEVGARANGVLEGIEKGPGPTVKNPYTGPMRGGNKANKVKRQQQNKSRQQNRPNKAKEKRIKRKKERKSRGGTS